MFLGSSAGLVLPGFETSTRRTIVVPSHFDLQGHRGCRGLMPENTLAAFRHALQIGVTTLELDTGISADGQVVVCHDRSLNPDFTRDASGAYLREPVRVNTLTLAQLRTHDVGRINPDTAYAQRFASQRAIDGTRMPALAELLELVQRESAHPGVADVRFNIETKISPVSPGDTVNPQTFVDKLLSVIDAKGMTDRCTIQSFDWRTLDIVRALKPAMSVAYLTVQQTWANNLSDSRASWMGKTMALAHNDVPSLVRAAAGDSTKAIWSPYFAEAPRALVKRAQSLGLKVVPWTPNSEKELLDVIDSGADGLITDYPDRARALLTGLGVKLPTPLPL
jgi:glycerophosphoryl diester phosphodiesterase